MDGSPLKGILDTVGNTPLVELTALSGGAGFRLYAKLERFNPGGSTKDRTALSMVRARVVSGELVPGRSTIVESSSGNLGVGLAQICRYYGLRFVCVVDARTTEQNLAILRAYGAEVERVCDPDPSTGEYLPVRLRRTRELVASIPDAYWPNQYANPLNPRAHRTTMAEIAESLDGRVDYLFAAASTFGTLRGCAEYVQANGLATTVVGVDAVGSVIFGPEHATGTHRLLPGHGASVPPPLAAMDLVDRAVHVTDLECVVQCRRLVAREAILAGGSSGAVVAAVERLRGELPAGANAVAIFPDGGDRYLDTIYSDAWVRRHFGEVSHLWKERT
ncbi:2,3-diaminopropionate biosynthesis protein SbnA [Actinomadura violacea]|uniref:2,3-diaminopropionate biosynthesis protein SbnA n=1 Tax=Actinomadura violacea TaxID=2819934 RepID=A0ABS3RNJ7_9ACTN|nr:2,3-diaminopropionate biosynthesis protein SbnA [Actinomadura violacea]MBO2458314.1 2,3-diaminopropionate biosynthesis protein SbnA [Actinomadura violacea]